MKVRERERIYISSQDSIHMFNHGLIFVSDLRSNMVNTDLLPAAPWILSWFFLVLLLVASQWQITIVGTNSTEHQAK